MQRQEPGEKAGREIFIPDPTAKKGPGSGQALASKLEHMHIRPRCVVPAADTRRIGPQTHHRTGPVQPQPVSEAEADRLSNLICLIDGTDAACEATITRAKRCCPSRFTTKFRVPLLDAESPRNHVFSVS